MVRSALVLVLVLLALVVACGGPPEKASRFGSDLHEHPARCGMPEYQWLDDDTLGDVLDREPIRAYEPQFFSDLFDSLENEGAAVVNRRPTYTAYLDRFRYVTQDKGALTDATGLYAWPVTDDDNHAPFPIILMTHGTTGYADACAPSAIAFNNPLAPDALMAGALASFGFVVVSSDYLGMKSMGEPSKAPHPYIVGEPTAIASLDAGRAAYNLASEDHTALGPLFIAGASQGGHAAGMTVRYQPHYANDLHPTAALYLIPPLNLLGHTRRILSSTVDPVTLGNMGAVLMGHASWFGQDLADIMSPKWAASIEQQTRDVCGLPEIDAPLEDVLQPDALVAARDAEDFVYPPWDCMMRESSLVEMSVPRLEALPALVVTGEIDPLVNADIEREGAHKLCASGMRIEFVECDGQDHIGAVETSLNQIFDFVDDRLAGKPLQDECVDRPIQICSSDPRNFE